MTDDDSAAPGTRSALDAESDRLAWRLAVEAAGVGAFVWDLVTGDLRWDGRLLELFGLDEGSFGGTIEAFNQCLHPDDLGRVSDALQSAIATCGDYQSEYRIVLPDGTVRWVEARGHAFPDAPGGPPVRLVGAAYDTTHVRDREARVGRVLESMSSAFYHLDEEWRFTYVNSEAERLLGSSRLSLIGASIWEAFPAAVGSAFEEHYRGAVASGEPVTFEAYYPLPLDGWYEVRAWPSPEGLAVYFVDITARRNAQAALDRSAHRLALLASVSEALTATLDPTEGVSRLATRLVPELADWCLVTFVEDPHAADWRRGLRDVGWSHRDPAMEDTLRDYAVLRLRAMTDRSYLAQAIRDMTPVLMESSATEAVAAVLEPGAARDRLRQLAPFSAAVVPLRARGRTVGVVSVFRDIHRTPFTADDVTLLEDVGARAALALDNARLYESQRDVSEALQRSMLTAPPHREGLQVATRYTPAGEAARIGGDWYDAFLQGDGASTPPDIVVVVGDVVGHDVEAAAAMGQVRGLLRGIAVQAETRPLRSCPGSTPSCSRSSSRRRPPRWWPGSSRCAPPVASRPGSSCAGPTPGTRRRCSSTPTAPSPGWPTPTPTTCSSASIPEPTATRAPWRWNPAPPSCSTPTASSNGATATSRTASRHWSACSARWPRPRPTSTSCATASSVAWRARSRRTTSRCWSSAGHPTPPETAQVL